MSVQNLAATLRDADPERFLSVMALPPERRAPLFALYAFNLEAARTAAKASEPMIGQMRLQWWVDAVTEMGAGKPPRHHEIALAIAPHITEERATRLAAILQARRADLEPYPFETPDALCSYLSETNGHLTVLAGALSGASRPEALQEAGTAIGLANWLRAVPALRAAGRHPLPNDDPDMIRAMALEGLDRLKSQPKDRSARPALLLSPVARRALSKAARDPDRVFAGRLEPSPARLRSGLIWRSLFL